MWGTPLHPRHPDTIGMSGLASFFIPFQKRNGIKGMVPSAGLRYQDCNRMTYRAKLPKPSREAERYLQRRGGVGSADAAKNGSVHQAGGSEAIVVKDGSHYLSGGV